jgi:hemoglobin
MSKEQKSLYDKLGGRQSIELMVADFYQSMLNDDDLNTFYIENVSEISDLHYTQTHFMVMLVGGPNFYKGRNMY